MRTLIITGALLLTACSQQGGDSENPSSAALEDGLWSGEGGSGLCKAADSAAFIIKAEDGSNCMAQGSVEAGEGGLAFIPRGDKECRIPITQDGETLTFDDGGAACSYYCGGTATLAGQTLQRSTATDSRLEDIAGDPLC